MKPNGPQTPCSGTTNHTQGHLESLLGAAIEFLSRAILWLGLFTVPRLYMAIHERGGAPADERHRAADCGMCASVGPARAHLKTRKGGDAARPPRTRAFGPDVPLQIWGTGGRKVLK